MAKRARKKGKAGGAKRRRTGGGRVEPTPPWESVWRRASGEGADIWWLLDAETVGAEEAIDPVPAPHGVVFRVLDALASAPDGLSTLSVLADIYDKTDGVVNVESQLRAIAEQATDRSEAALLAGYMSPQTASLADASATAGRLLRGFRDHDISEMVAAANVNPEVFSSRPNVGVLTLAPILAYEFTRSDDDPPLNEHIADFLDSCQLSIAGAEELLLLVLGGLLSEKAPEQIDEVLASELAARVVGERRLVDRFMEYALRLEAVMNSSRAATALHQCGAEFKASFAGETALLATMISETQALQRFREHEPAEGSVYGLWLAWLSAISPKGFRHRSVGSFSPDDLVSAFLANLDKTPLERLQREIRRQPPPAKSAFQGADGALELRVEWLNSLAAVLVGQESAVEVLVSIVGDNVERWAAYGPVGPSTSGQVLYLTIIALQEAADLDEDGKTSHADELRPDLHRLGSQLAQRIAAAVAVGGMPESESRSLSAWLDLLVETVGVEPGQPPDDFDVSVVPDELDTWLSHTCWWVKHRGWRLAKERPAVDELDLPVEVIPASLTEVVPPVEKVTALLVPDRPVRVVFVGGNERQAKIAAYVDSEVAERHGGLVEIEWVHIDWTSSPGMYADKVTGRIAHGADVVILMPLVRTGTGAQIRRSSGDLGVPWVPCTGRGKASVNRSIDEAVQVVCRLRATR